MIACDICGYQQSALDTGWDAGREAYVCLDVVACRERESDRIEREVREYLESGEE